MIRLPCGTQESHLSALLDDALPGAARERLASHSLDCRHCTAALADLRLTRDLVRRHAHPTAPDRALAERLVAIGSAPVATGVPGRRAPDPLAGLRRRRNLLAGPAPRVGALLVLVTMALVTGVGWVAAPGGRGEVADPGQSHVEYAGSAAAALLGPVATAAALGAPPGSLEASRDARRALAGHPVAPGPRLTPREVAALVQLADRATTRVHVGVWELAVSDGSTDLRATVTVRGRPGQGTELHVADASGTEVAASFVPVGDGWDPHAVAAFATRVRALAGQSVAGRSAVVLQAEGAGQVVRRWWVDDSTGVLLRTETRVAGRLTETAGYSSVDLGPDRSGFLSHLAPSLNRTTAAQSLTTSAALSLDQHGWFCRQRVAGLDLVAARGGAGDRPDRLHLTYADATQQVVVLQQPGSLPRTMPGFVRDEAAGVWVRRGWPTVVTWQSGSTVFSVVGVAPAPVLSEVVGSLPHGTGSDTPVDRVRSGWERVGGLVFG